MDKIRWGLLGAGNIVHRWINGTYGLADQMEIVAVASRTEARAREMAEAYGIPEALTYQEMLCRPDIDAVYIPVPHTAHKELAIRAMEAGKHVLVEKPAAVCAADFREMAACAERNHVFLMEGVWSRFFPLYEEVRKQLGAEGIGQVRSLHCSFSFRASDEFIEGRLFRRETAGGGLLDVGVYTLHLAEMIFGKAPKKLVGLASMDTDHLHLQVDEQASFLAQYDDGALAVLSCGVRTEMEDTAYIYGTQGYLKIPRFWSPSQLIIVRDGTERTLEFPIPSTGRDTPDEGFRYEIAHVNDCIRKGLTQSPVCTFQKSLLILEQCDELRRQWNLTFPTEETK